MRRLITLCVAFTLALLTPALACGQEAGDEGAEPTGLDYLNAAREAEASGHPLQALILAGIVVGYRSVLLLDDNEYPTALSTNPNIIRDANTLITNNIGIFQWSSSVLARQYDDAIEYISWSPNGQYLLVKALYSPSFEVWSTGTGRLLYTIKDPECCFSDATWSPDSLFFAICDSSCGMYRQLNSTSGIYYSIRIFNVLDGAQFQSIECDLEPLTSISWSTSGRYIACGGMSSIFYVWDNVDYKIITKQKVGSQIRNISWNNDDSLIVLGGNKICIFDITNNSLLSTIDSEHINAAWSPNGLYIATWLESDTINILDTGSFDLSSALIGHERKVTCVSWSPDGMILASGSYDETIRLWNPSDGSEIINIVIGTGYPMDISWSPDGAYVAVCDSNGYISEWDTTSGLPIDASDGHRGAVLCADLSPDGQRIVSGGTDRTVRIWDSSSGSPLFTLGQHNDWVSSVSWSPNGQYIASGEGRLFDEYHSIHNGRHNVYIWDLNTRKPILSIAEHPGSVTKLSWNENSDEVSIHMDAGAVYVWNIINKILINNYEEPVDTEWHTIPIQNGSRSISYGMDLRVEDLTGNTQGRFNADILRFVEFDGTEVRFINPLGNIGEVLSIHRQ